MRISFQNRLFIDLVLLIFVLFLILGLVSYKCISDQLYERTADRARYLAEKISELDNLQYAIEQNDISQISQIMSDISKFSDASYIVIGDIQARHLYHSVSPELVHTKMVGDDNAPVLVGNEIMSQQKGTLGMELRIKVPIINPQQKVIGIVSVGYLKRYLNDILRYYVIHIALVILFIIIMLFIFSWYFTRGIKKQMHLLEPYEIGVLVRQQKAVLESIYEGVIAINEQGAINVINRAARKLLMLDQPNSYLPGTPVAKLIKTVSFLDMDLIKTCDVHDELVVFNQKAVIASRVRIYVDDKLKGWVITFRDKNEIECFSEQLSQVKRYVNDLRVIRHEQLNKMSTIAGLLNMGRHNEALNCIQTQSSHAQKILDFLANSFHSPLLCGLLLGKYSRAKEKGVEMNFDPSCFMPEYPAIFSDSELISIVGNLLDNAIESTQKMPFPHGPINVLIQQNERELLIEIADNGVGISAELKSSMFLPGVTTKQHGDHGIGLHLIANYVNRANGVIEVSDNIPRGTIFSLFIPISPSHLLNNEDPAYET